MEAHGNKYKEAEVEKLKHFAEPVTQWAQTHQLEQGLSLLQEIQVVVSAPYLRETTPLNDHLRTYCLALLVECGEFVNELAWKPWKPGKAVDPDKVQDEFADILAFLGVIMVLMLRLYPSISIHTLASAYIKKTQTNVARFTGQVPEYVDRDDTWTKA